MRLAYQFQGQKVRVIRRINADTHRAPYVPNGKAYELQTWYMDGGMEDDDPHQPQAPSPARSKVKVTRSRDNMYRVAPITHKSKTNSHSITKICRRYPMTRATLRISFKVKGQIHRPTNAGTQNVPYLPNGKA